MPKFMDIHHNMKGLTADQLREAHQADLDIQGDEGVTFEHAWADTDSGEVFCLSDAPSAEAVQRIHERAGHKADEVHQLTLSV
ncbi:SCO4226 family nickel-binding protein [Streptomyces sp. NPDC059649]|uniref:SCO4226 family nickel-binding protein n=1 Tax=Streptomyces sp. NPDC059649 TaxID=3346895 RepID=UPI0036801302